MTDLLDALRGFGVPHIETEADFIMLWMTGGNAQGRFDLFYELDRWQQEYGYYGIYDFIGQLIMMWDLVQGYERDHPKFKTLKEADEHFNHFITKKYAYP